MLAQEDGPLHEMTSLMRKVAPSLEKLPDLEAQLQELASFKADMQAALQAMQQAQTKAQAPKEPPANHKEVHPLRHICDGKRLPFQTWRA